MTPKTSWFPLGKMAICFLLLGLFFSPVSICRLASSNLTADAVHQRLDWVMSQWYRYGKDDDTWLFVDYDAVTGEKITDWCYLRFLDKLMAAHIATGNQTYLEWLQKAYDSILVHGLSDRYAVNIDVNGYRGTPSSRINIVTNTEDAYSGDLYDLCSFITASLYICEQTGNDTLFQTAESLVDAIIYWRTNQTTGLTINYDPRHSQMFVWNDMYSYAELMYRQLQWLQVLHLMDEYSGDLIYKRLIDTFWTWLINKYPDGRWNASRFWADGSEYSVDVNAIKVFPDTVEWYTYCFFRNPNQTVIDYWCRVWDRYYEQWWSEDHFSCHNNLPWIGAELNALVETYLLTGNETFLEWAEQDWSWWLARLSANGLLRDATWGSTDVATVFNVYWDFGQATIRLWLVTGRQEYRDYMETCWINSNANFSKSYGYVKTVNIYNRTVQDSKAILPVENYFASLISAFVHGDNSYFAGYFVSFFTEHIEDESTPNRLLLSVSSNSTVSELTMLSEYGIIDFLVEGPTGTVGYVEVVIAKTILAEADSLRVYVDGEETGYSATSDPDDYWLIRFQYAHSRHQVHIVYGVQEDNNAWSLLVVTVLAGLLAYALVRWCRK